MVWAIWSDMLKIETDTHCFFYVVDKILFVSIFSESNNNRMNDHCTYLKEKKSKISNVAKKNV